jgi:hypothetical protein
MKKYPFKGSLMQIRFVAIFDALLESKKVSSKSQLGGTIGSYGHIMTECFDGKRKVTVKMIQLLVTEYGVNANYLFGKSETMFGDFMGDVKRGNIVLSKTITMMDITETEEKPIRYEVGDGVTYVAFHGAVPEHGVVSSVQDLPEGGQKVWVKYRLNGSGQLTPTNKLV